MFKNLTKKVVADVKETVKEETQKTTEEIKGDVIETIRSVIPSLIIFSAGALLVGLIHRPTVTVKVVVKQV